MGKSRSTSFRFFNRPLTMFARQTLTDTDILPPRLAEAETAIASRYYLVLVPERHVAFAWAGLSRRSFQAKSDRPGKKYLLSAHVCGKNICLLIATNGDQRLISLNATNSFGDDPKFKNHVFGCTRDNGLGVGGGRETLRHRMSAQKVEIKKRKGPFP